MLSYDKIMYIAPAIFAAGFVAAAAEEAPTCNLSCSAPRRDFFRLRTCLDEAFPPDDDVRLGFHNLTKVTYPGEDMYSAARRTQFGNMRPAVVVMAENEADVITTVNCAVGAGYRVSPRGRGHHFQGLSNADGYVVLDCSLLCDPDNFVVERKGGDWLLEGQKYIASVTGGAGCTNAVMLAAVHKKFDPEDGALYAIGTCPSVGIVGYTTGGGAGDITPYVGWGADDILEARMVLWDGSVVTANGTHNADLFWATQGGGSGYGVVTSLKTVVPQAPAPPPGEASRKYCWVSVRYGTPDEESRRKFLTSLQDYLYEADPLVSSKFGGGGGLSKESKRLNGIFLGSAKEFLSNFGGHGLLEDEHLRHAGVNSSLMLDYDVLCDGTVPCEVQDGAGPDVPSVGVADLAEFGTYGEALLYKLCVSLSPWEKFGLGPANTMTQSSGNWCADLGISSEFCTTLLNVDLMTMEACTGDDVGLSEEVCRDIIDNGLTPERCVEFEIPNEYCQVLLTPLYHEPDCRKREVISALADAAYDPLGFLNQQGPPEWIWIDPYWGSWVPGNDLDNVATSPGGMLLPKVDVDTLMDLDEIGIGLNHFQHGAPLTRSSDATAFPWRDTAIMLEFHSGESMEKVFSRMAKFYGHEGKLQGYYNYMNPPGNPHWRYYYFGENAERLGEIKLKYDPHNFFGHTNQIEPAVPRAESDTDSGGGTAAEKKKHHEVLLLSASVLAGILLT